MKILGIETSADEAAAAVVEDGRTMLSNVIASSIDLTTKYGGIVPEVVARSHIEAILPVVTEALQVAKTDWDEIDAIAVTQGPGLLGSLLIGVLTARTLAIVKNKPLYAINHVIAHTFATFLTDTSLPGYQLPQAQPDFPLLCLTVSGGHTQLLLFKNPFDWQVLGQTQDDAVGEAFDKVAQILGLPYPGGPSIAQAALHGRSKYNLPIAKLQSPYDFSFSGLKTAVLRAAQTAAGQNYRFASSGLKNKLNDRQKADLAASFQTTAVKTLVGTLLRAYQNFQPASIVIAGGVAANQALRSAAEKALPLPITCPDIGLCTDNAAMIATLGCLMYQADQPTADPLTLPAKSTLSFT